MIPKLGQAAPAFALPSTSGKTVALSNHAGKRVVLYFYPRDDTPGCTRESCAFRDEHAQLRRAGAVVLGVSADSLASHDKFRAKYALPFELLSDGDKRVARAYGAYGEKSLYGKKVVGTIRSTFLIGRDGKLEAVWSPVKVDGHVAQVLAALTGRAPAPAPAKSKLKSKSKSALQSKPAVRSNPPVRAMSAQPAAVAPSAAPRSRKAGARRG
jgi:peroxiredoxin Q/BCP